MRRHQKQNGDGAPKGQRFDANDYAPDSETTLLEAGTLTGDVRDVLLTHVRAIKVPWALLAEDEQRDIINALSKCAEDVVRRTVRVVTAADFPTVVVELKEFKIKGGIELKCAAAGLIENITHLAEHGTAPAVLVLAEHGTAPAVLVLAEASIFFGERAAARPDKDQRDLPLEGEGAD
jgi:CHAD domain-containing protein